MKPRRFIISRRRLYTTVTCLISILAAFLCLQQQCLARQQDVAHALAASASCGKPSPIAGWIYCSLAVCLITGGVIGIRRRNRTPRRHHHRRARPPVFVPQIKNKALLNSAPSNQLSSASKINESNSHATAKPVSSPSNGWKPFNHIRRKRSFDHSKFYMEVMRNLSYSCVQTSATNGKSNSNGHAAANVENAKQATKSEIEDLIAAQKNLIEQQSRLIEEKRRLIEEQTALLKTESDLAADEPYPLKFG
jgi:hypothetical protein